MDQKPVIFLGPFLDLEASMAVAGLGQSHVRKDWIFQETC